VDHPLADDGLILAHYDAEGGALDHASKATPLAAATLSAAERWVRRSSSVGVSRGLDSSALHGNGTRA
jgi:hypothetical protein